MKATMIEDKTAPGRPVLSLPKGSGAPRNAANDSIAPITAIRGARAGWDDTKITITRKPKPGQVYFIAAASGACAPEFEGYHPGVIIRVSPQFTADAGTVVYVPLTRHEPEAGPAAAYPYIHRLSASPGPDPALPAWAVCNHLMTANMCRLELFQYPGEGARVGNLSRADFDAILDCVAIALPSVRNRVEASMRANFDRERDEIMRRHEVEILLLRQDFDERMAAREFELIDDFTTPKKFD